MGLAFGSNSKGCFPDFKSLFELNKPLILFCLRVTKKWQSMAERKHKRGSAGVAELDEDSEMVLEPSQIELGSGYSLAVRFDENERTVVDIKTYGQVDLARVRKDIEGIFPNAQIRHKVQPQTVTVKKSRKLSATKK